MAAEIIHNLRRLLQERKISTLKNFREHPAWPFPCRALTAPSPSPAEPPLPEPSPPGPPGAGQGRRHRLPAESRAGHAGPAGGGNHLGSPPVLPQGAWTPLRAQGRREGRRVTPPAPPRRSPRTGRGDSRARLR